VRKERKITLLTGAFSAVEEESGIGGRMVRTTGRTTTEQQGVDGDGKEALQNSEFAGMNADAEKAQVASQFAERALRGDPGGLHPIFSPSNQAVQLGESETKRNDFSQAIAWGAEPEWHGESCEAASETAAGSREPESFSDEC